MLRYSYLFTIIFTINLFSQPSITSISTAMEDSVSVTISGSNFGTKSTAAPVKSDGFESGTVGEDLGNSWVIKKNTDWDQSAYPKYTGSANHTAVDGISYSPPLRNGSNRSVVCDFTGQYQYNCSFGLDQTFTGYMLVSFWGYHRTDMGTVESDNFKMLRMYGNYSDGNPVWGLTDQISNTWSYIWSHTEDDVNRQQWNSVDVSNDDGNWHQFEFLLKQSSGNGVADGVFIFIRDGYTSNYITDAVHKDKGYNWAYLRIGHFVGGHTDGARQLSYYDDVYIDNSWARVVVGDNVNINNCTYHEYQIPSSWSPSSITITANQGESSGQAYLFVVDSDNTASDGFAFTWGTEPEAPENEAPLFYTHPTDKDREEGEDVSFTARASGTPTPTYQWRVDSTGSYEDVTGETSTTLTFTTALSDSGNYYRCIATNSEGADTSNAALLRVYSTSVPAATMKQTIHSITKTSK